MCASVDNCRLFVGGIPKTKKKEEILAEMKKVTDGVMEVIVYPSAADKSKNRGFAFVEYESHRAAAMARRKLLPGILTLFTIPKMEIPFHCPALNIVFLCMVLNRFYLKRKTLRGSSENKYFCNIRVCIYRSHPAVGSRHSCGLGRARSGSR